MIFPTRLLHLDIFLLSFNSTFFFILLYFLFFLLGSLNFMVFDPVDLFATHPPLFLPLPFFPFYYYYYFLGPFYFRARDKSCWIFPFYTIPSCFCAQHQADKRLRSALVYCGVQY